MTPSFSILHTTARREGWKASYDAWYKQGIMCRSEYVLCMDRRWGFTSEDAEEARKLDIKVVWNNGRRCMVDGYSYAAAASTKSVLILNSDDMRPCVEWDWQLSTAICNKTRVDYDFVVQVKSDAAADERGLMVLQILSRARYERLGYALYPGYESLYADDEFGDHARQDGVVIDATHLVFPHLHFTEGKSEVDEVYQHQNRPTSMQLGMDLYNDRKRKGFPLYGKA